MLEPQQHNHKVHNAKGDTVQAMASWEAYQDFEKSMVFAAKKLLMDQLQEIG